GDAEEPRSVVSRDRHRRGRPRHERRTQVRRRGLGSHPGRLPRAHLHEQLHDVPGAPPRHPAPRRRRKDEPRRDPQRHTRHDPLDRGTAGDAPAGRRLGSRAGAAATLPRARGAGARDVTGTRERWLIGLDIDGTVLTEDGELDPRVASEIRRVRDLGHEVMPATGRSVSMTLPVIDRLDIAPAYAVSANGAIVMRRDRDAPVGYVRDRVETFDATEVLTTVREHLQGASYAV